MQDQLLLDFVQHRQLVRVLRHLKGTALRLGPRAHPAELPLGGEVPKLVLLLGNAEPHRESRATRSGAAPGGRSALLLARPRAAEGTFGCDRGAGLQPPRAGLRRRKGARRGGKAELPVLLCLTVPVGAKRSTAELSSVGNASRPAGSAAAVV